jgi:hypothetical protein
LLKLLAVALVAVAALFVAALVILGPPGGTDSNPGAASSARATSPTTTAVSPSPGAATGLVGAFENAILGYQITLPQGYRRSRSDIVSGQGDFLGLDYFTLQTEAEAREACQRDVGDVFSGSRDSDLRVGVSRNPRAISVTEWVNTPRSPGAQPLSTHRQVEPVAL